MQFRHRPCRVGPSGSSPDSCRARTRPCGAAATGADGLHLRPHPRTQGRAPRGLDRQRSPARGAAEGEPWAWSVTPAGRGLTARVPRTGVCELGSPNGCRFPHGRRRTVSAGRSRRERWPWALAAQGEWRSPDFRDCSLATLFRSGSCPQRQRAPANQCGGDRRVPGQVQALPLRFLEHTARAGLGSGPLASVSGARVPGGLVCEELAPVAKGHLCWTWGHLRNVCRWLGGHQ